MRKKRPTSSKFPSLDSELSQSSDFLPPSHAGSLKLSGPFQVFTFVWGKCRRGRVQARRDRKPVSCLSPLPGLFSSLVSLPAAFPAWTPTGWFPSLEDGGTVGNLSPSQISSFSHLKMLQKAYTGMRFPLCCHGHKTRFLKTFNLGNRLMELF